MAYPCFRYIKVHRRSETMYTWESAGKRSTNLCQFHLLYLVNIAITTTANHLKIGPHLELSNEALTLAGSPFATNNTGPGCSKGR